MPNRFIDNVYVLKFLRIITRPWKEQPAFKSGVIDNFGNIVVKPNKQTISQRQSYTKFDVMAWNIKKLIEKVPLGKTTIAKYLAALKLLKENVSDKDYEQIGQILSNHLKEQNIDEETINLLFEEDGGGDASGAGSPVTNTTGGMDIAEVPYGAFKKKKKKKKE